MSDTNCPNCGAAIDVEQNKCPYCGTPYIDLCCIQSCEPFTLRVNVGTRKRPRIITQKVYMSDFTVETSSPINIMGRTMDGRITVDHTLHHTFNITLEGV